MPTNIVTLTKSMAGNFVYRKYKIVNPNISIFTIKFMSNTLFAVLNKSINGKSRNIAAAHTKPIDTEIMPSNER